MSSELVKVNFHGDVLEAVQDGDRVRASLRRCCENLGLNFPTQYRKLKGKAWAGVGEMTIRDARGHEQPATMIDLDSLPMWLATIDARRVKEEVREKLARYQKEAARVLADHFFGRGLDAPPPTAAILTALLNRIESLESRLTALPAPVIHLPVPATPRFTVRQRLAWKCWNDTSAKQRKQIYRLAVAKLDARHDETPDVAGGPGGGGPARFYGHQLACLDEAIDEVREIYVQRERRSGPDLFDRLKSSAA